MSWHILALFFQHFKIFSSTHEPNLVYIKRFYGFFVKYYRLVSWSVDSINISNSKSFFNQKSQCWKWASKSNQGEHV